MKELSLPRTKGSVEAEISKALTQWEKDSLCESKEGLLTIKRTRSDLVESGVETLKNMIFDIPAKKSLRFIPISAHARVNG